MPSPFHSGELEVQERAGVRAAAGRVGGMIRDRMTLDHAEFIAAQELAVLAGSDRAGRVWASPLTGSAGFLRPLSSSVVEVMAMLALDDPLVEIVAQGGVLGMVVMDFATRSRVRLNGRCEPQSGGGFLLHLREAYGNCPKYIQRRELSPGAALTGAALPAAQAGLGLTSEQRAAIAVADTFFIASLHGEQADASHRGGNPGFVHVADSSTLRWPDYSGNRLFNTLGNLASDSRAGLLFLDFAGDRALHLTGTAHILWDAPANGVARVPGEERAVEFHVMGVVERGQATRRRWTLLERSPHNP